MTQIANVVKATVCGTDTVQESVFLLLEPVVQWTLLHILEVLGVSSLGQAVFNTNNLRNPADNCAGSGSLPLNTERRAPAAPTSVTKASTKMQGCGMWRDHGGENCDFISSRLSMKQAAYRVTGCRVLNRLIHNLNFPSGKTNSEYTIQKSGKDSVVGIATRYYWPESLWFECRWRRHTPDPIQTGPEDHPASCTMGIGSFFPGVKRPGRDVDHPPPSRVEVKERVKLYLHLVPVPTWHVTGQLLPHKNVYFCSNNIY